MRIYIKNKNPKDLNCNNIFAERTGLLGKEASIEITRAVAYFIKKLGIDDNSEIKIVWRPLKQWVGLQTQIPKDKNKFIIEINSLVYPVLKSIEDVHTKDYSQTNSLIVGLAHEVIHIKQIFKNELSYSDVSFHPQGTLKWKNEYFTKIKKRSHFLTENAYNDYYENLPWEREAFDNMDKLSLQYLRLRPLILFKERLQSKIRGIRFKTRSYFLNKTLIKN